MQVGSGARHNLKVIDFEESVYVYNYDFHSREAAAFNVDWPVTIVFVGNASVSKVKALYWADHGEKKSFNFRDGDLSEWLEDEGTKSKGITACHMRLYAANGDYSQNVKLGKCVIGTTHYDKCEGWPWPWRHQVGWSEDAGREVLRIAKKKGYRTVEKMWNWNNYEEGYWEGNRWYQCDGWVSVIEIP
ncbi:MAG: hypothetical protein PHV74_06445 [Dehalococcoidia bacterium]|nr:hypothetical protein [Dehalococcoidia bacterium]